MFKITHPNKKYVFILMAILCLSAMLLCSCNKQKEGNINDVDISSEDEANKDKNFFVKKDDPFGYKWKTYEATRAFQKIEIPSSWEVSTINTNYIKLQAPSDDRHFPGTTFNIIYNYTDVVSATELPTKADSLPDEVLHMCTGELTATKAMDAFEDPLLGATFNVGGVTNASLSRYYVPDKIVSNLDFDNSSSKQNASLTTTKVTMQNDGTKDILKGDFIQSTMYITWHGVSGAITTVTEEPITSDAQTMLKLMTSSIKYVPAKVGKMQTVDVSGLNLKIPSYFVRSDEYENIYRAPFDVQSPASGMAIGVFKIDPDAEDITEESLRYTYGENIVAAMSGVNDYNVHLAPYKVGKVKIGKMSAVEFVAECPMTATSSRHNHLSFYGSSNNCSMMIYDIKASGGNEYLLCMWFLGTEDRSLLSKINKSLIANTFIN